MLVLSRRESETICIGNDIEIVVTQIAGGRVRLGIRAPREVVVSRGELLAGNVVEPVVLAPSVDSILDNFTGLEAPPVHVG